MNIIDLIERGISLREVSDADLVKMLKRSKLSDPFHAELHHEAKLRLMGSRPTLLTKNPDSCGTSMKAGEKKVVWWRRIFNA